METLTTSDVLALNRVIGEIYSVRDLESFHRSVFHSIQSIIPNEHCSFTDFNIIHPRFLKVISGSQDHHHVINKLLPVLNTHLHEHPLFPHVSSESVLKITDFTSKGQFKNMAIYNEYYRHIDVEMQISFSIPISQETLSFVALSRNTTDFSERDRLMLALLKPHVINALRNMMELEQLRLERELLHRGAEAQRQGALLCKQNGLVLCISELAREMISRYFAMTLLEGDTLPEALERWLQMEAGNGGTTGRSVKLPKRVERDVFVVEKEGKRLIIKLVNDISNDDCLLCITENDPAALFQNLQRYGLSPCETEVIRWLAKGKTNGEIAVILGTSKRTTDKHLEHIYAKLGVETRGAAVAIIRDECDLD
jgi:DNA-binding CsgD family transcriptional regulator